MSTIRNKQRLIHLYRYLMENTDEEHQATTNELVQFLKKEDANASRKTVKDDIEILMKEGVDIVTTKSYYNSYFVGSRDFEVPELKLLVDAIQSSKFITHSKSLKLIKKLEGLVSENEGKKLQREVVVTNRVKTINEQIYYNVDEIYCAISQDKKISFKYMKWSVDFAGAQKIVKVERRKGENYIISPFALCWDDENYYLVGFDATAKKIKHFRVDKMENISIINEGRDGSEKFAKFDLAHYAKCVFSMFGGEECDVKLSVDNDLIGVIVDRFGSDIFIVKETEKSFVVTVRVALSPQFYAWLFGLGLKVKVLSPKKAIDDYKSKIQELKTLY